MKNIEFKEKSAQKIYDSYIRRISRTISVLSDNDKKDVLMEFNSHIYEGLHGQNNENEVESLLKITLSLGDPEEVLKPLIAEKKLNEATRTFNPKHIIQAIFLNIKSGMLYTIFAILYLFLFSFAFLIISKILNPSEVGLFFKDGSFITLGKLKTTEKVIDVLGDKFIPVMLVIAILLYIIITLMLKFTKRK